MLRCLLIGWMAGAAALGLAAEAARAQSGDSIFTGDRENADWRISGSQATLTSPNARPGPTMVIDADAFASQPLTLRLETDGDQFMLKAGSRQIEIPLGEAASHTVILTGGAKPSVQLDGAVVSSAQRLWERIHDKPSIDIIFPDARRAKVAWQRGGVDRPADDDLMTADTTDSNAAFDDPADLLARARRGVVRLRIDTDAPGIALRAQAIVVRSNGVMICPAHAINGARSIRALLPVDASVNVRVLAVEPAVNLAVLRLDPTSAQWQSVVEPMTIADAAPAEGAKLYAAGFDQAGDFVTGQTIARQTVLTERLPRVLQQSLGVRPTARWIATDRPVTAEVSGGPLIDAAGRLVGVNVWTWPEQINGGLALSATDAAALVERADPLTFMTLDQARDAIGLARIGRLTFPLLVVTANQPARRLQDAVNRADDTIICPQCEGEGSLTVRRKLGYEGDGTLRRPVFQNQDVPCSRCKGTGLNHAPVVADVLGDVAANLAPARRDDEDYRRIAQWAGQTLVKIGQRRTVELMTAVNDQAFAQVSEDDLAIGDPLVVIGWRGELEATEHQATLPIVHPLGTWGERVVMLRGPLLQDNARAQAVLAGGLLAGYVTDRDNRRVPVIQRGYIIGVPTEDLPEPASRPDDHRSRFRDQRY